jgi:hypothetical protein
VALPHFSRYRVRFRKVFTGDVRAFDRQALKLS